MSQFLTGGTKKKKTSGDGTDSNLDENGNDCQMDDQASEDNAAGQQKVDEEVPITIDQYVQGPSYSDDSMVVGNAEGIVRLAVKPESVLLGQDNQLSHPKGFINDYGCPWDAIFQSESGKSAADGIEQLIELFGDPEADAVSRPEFTQVLSQGSVHLSMLTPERKAASTSIIQKIESKESTLQDLQKACPDWKENVAFAMKQQNKREISEALDKVRQRREQMKLVKAKLLEAWKQQMTTLDVFEESLSESLRRREDPLREIQGGSQPTSQCSQQSVFHG